MSVKIILWDVDGTLLNFKAAEKAAIRKCFEIHDLGPCTDEMINIYSSINDSYWKRLERGEISKPEVLVGRFREFFEKYGIDPGYAEAFNSDYQTRLGDTICFEDNAIETIRFFKKKGIRQYAVTNGTKIAQQRKLTKSGLIKELDAVFISEDIGYEKPMIGFFDAVFASVNGDLNISRDEILIVGDSMTSDIQGGWNAGIRTCLYNTGEREIVAERKIDIIIEDLWDLTDLVK